MASPSHVKASAAREGGGGVVGGEGGLGGFGVCAVAIGGFFKGEEGQLGQGRQGWCTQGLKKEK